MAGLQEIFAPMPITPATTLLQALSRGVARPVDTPVRPATETRATAAAVKPPVRRGAPLHKVLASPDKPDPAKPRGSYIDITA